MDDDDRNEIMNKVYTWGLVVFAIVDVGLLVKMFMSAM